MKTTTILELRSQLDGLIAAGHGEVEIVAHTTGRKRPLTALLGQEEPIDERIHRQVECSITVSKMIEILKATDPRQMAPMYIRFDGGRSTVIDGNTLTRAEDGSHYLLFPGSNRNPCRANGHEIASMLEAMLAEEDPVAGKDIRLLVSRRSGPIAQRVHALTPGSVDNPYVTGGAGYGPIMLNGTIIQPDAPRDTDPDGAVTINGLIDAMSAQGIEDRAKVSIMDGTQTVWKPKGNSVRWVPSMNAFVIAPSSLGRRTRPCFPEETMTWSRLRWALINELERRRREDPDAAQRPIHIMSKTGHTAPLSVTGIKPASILDARRPAGRARISVAE